MEGGTGHALPAASKLPGARPRLDSIHLLRGLVMVVVLLDHARARFERRHRDWRWLGYP